MPDLQLHYALRPGATCVTPGNQAILLAPPRNERVRGLTTEQRQELRTFPAGSAFVDGLAERGWLSITVRWQGVDIYTIRPFGEPPPRPETGGGTLSKFAILRRTGSAAVLEHPMSWCDVDIHDARVLGAVTGLGGELPAELAERLAVDLAWTGHTVAEPEDTRLATSGWSAHELWFHRNSNVSERVLTWEHFGPTRWADGTFEPLPARRPAYPAPPVQLPAPDLEQLRADSPTITSVLEDRVSTRSFDDANPMTVQQLSELLYRTARTRSTRTADGVEYLSRPYPSGGAVYELELYPVVRNVEGLAPGLYHYDSFDHVLRLVADESTQAVDRLRSTSSLTLSEGQLPQVLIVLAARVGRLMWTYEQVPYAIILRHVGVVLQTVYLVATAMGLGAVAQGYGDTKAFTDATGVDELDECLVGTIVVGKPKENK